MCVIIVYIYIYIYIYIYTTMTHMWQQRVHMLWAPACLGRPTAPSSRFLWSALLRIEALG